MLKEKSSYTAVPVTTGGLGYRRVSLIEGTVAKLLAMDTPLLDDSDDVGRRRAGYYWAAGAYTPPWSACLLYESSDDLLYVAADTVFAGATWGAARTALPAPSQPFQTDRENTLNVAFAGDTPPGSVTDLEMLNGANRFALIRADGMAEIIHARDVAPNDGGSHTLSVLLRGRRGTEVFMDGHEAGELVLLLDGAVQRRLVELAQIEQTLYLRAVARGGTLADAPTLPLPFAGNDLRPYAPAHLSADQPINQGLDIGLSWVRRTRVGGELSDGTATMPLAEDSEAYEPEFLDDGGAVVRTVAGLTSPSYTYTIAEQAADAPVSRVRVYQVSAQVGRGFAAELTFDNAPEFTWVGESLADGLSGWPSTSFETDRAMAQQYPAVAGKVMALAAYVADGAATMRMGLYEDAGGSPGSLLASSAEKAIPDLNDNGRWEEFPLPAPVTATAGTPYWVCAHADGNVESVLPGSAATTGRQYDSHAFGSGLPDPFVTTSIYNNTRGMRMKIWTNP